MQDVGRCTKKANTQHRSEKDMQGDKRNKQNKQDDWSARVRRKNFWTNMTTTTLDSHE